MLGRRAVLAAALLGVLSVALPAAEAQQAGKVWRIGWLGDGTRAAREANTLTPLREGLRELGYIEGKNLFVDARWSDGDSERLARDAAEFVRLKVDVIVTHGIVGGAAAKRATTTIPIVIATAADLVGAGFVSSLARPGGNITGTSDQAGEVINKNLDILSELLPGLQRVAVLSYRGNPNSPRVTQALQGAARSRGLVATPPVASRPEDVAGLVDVAVRERARALIVVQDSWTLAHRVLIAERALVKRVPVLGATGLYAEAGALASYGADIPAVYRHAAVFVDKILKGTKPGDIPAEQPTKFELVINLKTAKALGITVPQSLRLRADRLIE